ncbi:hypothetical protein M378DRAFT_468990 [Amanita muscaria Koide BX008]|uniref:Uncharacterized protein n=1 Tax=Amanita muscaria (strain Koide BX008) TaxID=946122 RepID=A0A0C2WJX4_AMAMK|nr:hypothetical protein M378DRAFT_468990 [Amanita muscaria Koide BX008]
MLNNDKSLHKTITVTGAPFSIPPFLQHLPLPRMLLDAMSSPSHEPVSLPSQLPSRLSGAGGGTGGGGRGTTIAGGQRRMS